MKKAIVLVLVVACVISCAGCANSQVKIWDWAQELKEEDILAVTPRNQDAENEEFAPLSKAEIHELVVLLNKLTKRNFTQNKKGVGITPTVGMRIELSSGTCVLNYAPSPYGKYGMLEISFLGDDEMPWWVDSVELLTFFEKVTDSASAE